MCAAIAADTDDERRPKRGGNTGVKRPIKMLSQTNDPFQITKQTHWLPAKPLAQNMKMGHEITMRAS
jgi:hypothetical protein